MRVQRPHFGDRCNGRPVLWVERALDAHAQRAAGIELGEDRGVAQAPAMQDRDAIAAGQYVRQHVRGQDHRMRIGEGADQLAQTQRLDRIEARGRFVEHDQGRLVDDRLGQADALAKPLRQQAGQAPAHFAELAALDRTLDRGSYRRTRQSVQASAEAQVFLDTELAVERWILGQVTDLRACDFGMLVEVAPAESHAARTRREQARDHAQRGRLAGAVDAEQAEHFAAIEAEVDLLDDGAAGQAARYAVEGKHRGGFVHAGRIVPAMDGKGKRQSAFLLHLAWSFGV